MQVLADNGRYVLAEEGTRLLFFERRITPTWMVYVPGLITVIGLGNVVIQAIVGNLAAAALILAGSIVSGICWRVAASSRRRARSTPLDPNHALAQIDLGARTLLEGNGQVLCALDAVRVERTMQMTSSARALTIAWPGGKRVVYRGDALSLNGSIAAPAAALKQRGVPTTW